VNGAPPERPAEAPPIVIERLTHEDVAGIVALFRRIWEPYLTGMPPEVQRAWQPTPLEFTSGMEGVTYFAAKRDGHLVGVVGCELEHGSCHLVNLCVDAESRRQGIGTALVAAALGWAQHANARSIHVDVLHRFTEAMALLKDSGFAEAGVLHRHFWGEDVRLFEKIL
jgi:GNAT superfamily N-acetyltransferase